jgi:ABC-2 type transport system ATP-binding protein
MSTNGGPSDQPVVVQGLTKVYPSGVTAVAGISFEVGHGQIFGLLGPNGAGKTTTMGILTTLVRPSGGVARLNGHDVVTEALAVRRSMGVVFQDSVLDNDVSGRENLRFHARLWRLPGAAGRMASLLAAVGLTGRADDPVSTYSGGMRRRLEIARALLAHPRVLLLDEPTLGLDPVVRSELWQLIRGLKAAEDVTVVLSTHYLEEAEQVCDEVAILDQGRIVSAGSPSRLIDSFGRQILELRAEGPADPVVAALRAGPASLGPALAVGSTITAASNHDRDTLIEEASQLGLSGLGVVATMVRPATLNDVFLHLTAAGQASGPLVGAS